ncbi:MAG: hypothetical protein AB1486_10035 [Planctomycetota bacterium]
MTRERFYWGRSSCRAAVWAVALLLSLACQVAPPAQKANGGANGGSRAFVEPVAQPLGANNNLVELLDARTKDLHAAHTRVSELESDLAALTSEHAKLKLDFDDLSVTAQDRGEKLAAVEERLANLEAEIVRERDERARITDMFLTATIEKLRLERELLTLRLDLQSP